MLTSVPPPARHRFIRVLDCEDRICEFNQEACRIDAFNGKKSLVRSFPSKVGVSIRAFSNTNSNPGGWRRGLPLCPSPCAPARLEPTHNTYYNEYKSEVYWRGG